MIKVEALSRTYGDIVAVKDVSFEIGPREIVGLLGHNGAGKSTIMKMMTGYLEPSSGNISINGTDVWSERSTIQRQIGYLPENCPLYPEMRVLDYLDYAAALRGVPEGNRLDRIGYVIQKTNLIRVAEQSISTLSRGYKQRLGVAQAILNSPSILILDEPTNGLDPSQILEMRSLIQELAETATVIVSTHILQEVQAVCGRAIIISNGNVALDAAMTNLQKTGKLKIITDAEPERCSKILEQGQELRVVHSEKKANHFHYTIVPSTEDLSKSAARAARLLVEAGCNVYALHPVIQDLESIFAEITTKRTASGRMEKTQISGTEEVAQLVTAATGGSDTDFNGHPKTAVAAPREGVSNE